MIDLNDILDDLNKSIEYRCFITSALNVKTFTVLYVIMWKKSYCKSDKSILNTS